jgi:hypothetical protein
MEVVVVKLVIRLGVVIVNLQLNAMRVNQDTIFLG